MDDKKIIESEIIRKKKILKKMYDKWFTKDISTYLFTCIPICNEIDKLEILNNKLKI